MEKLESQFTIRMMARRVSKEMELIKSPVETYKKLVSNFKVSLAATTLKVFNLIIEKSKGFPRGVFVWM